MLNLAGRKPVMITFAEGTHGWDDVDQIEKAYTGIAGFLEKYLGTSSAGLASAPSVAPAQVATPALPVATH